MTHPSTCPGVTRRSFLADTGMGFTGIALGAMLYQDGLTRGAAPPRLSPPSPLSDRIGSGGGLGGWGEGRKPTPKAKSVIWIFLCGGVSHVESFDVKPELTKYAGKSIDTTPYKGVFNDPRI